MIITDWFLFRLAGFYTPANDNVRLFFWPSTEDEFLAQHRHDRDSWIAGHLGNTP